MPNNRPPDRSDIIPGLGDDFWEVEDPQAPGETVLVRPPASYRQAFGDEPIRVGIVEFHIMLFLASRPYHAFTRRQIADAAAAAGKPIDVDAVDDYVVALRDQLGILHDFVQTVPHVGYRYKA